MNCLVAAVLLSGILVVQHPILAAPAQAAESQSKRNLTSARVDLPTLPPAPRGKSTILGGQIRSVDPVRDEIKLAIDSKRSVRILFDERTQVFRDGQRIQLHDLSPSDHASVQTLLDGTDIFALTIHLLSQAPQGVYRGRVLNYKPDTRELIFSSSVSRDPITLLVPANASITRVGQPSFTSVTRGFSDLVSGSIVSVTFRPDGQGRGIADNISVLAAPGSDFVFAGRLSALDMHAGSLAITDTRDDTSYQIMFDPARLSITHDLHPGDQINVTASFDGERYIATAIRANR